MSIKRKKRKLTPLNGAALADISFLFLIFFLLTATMDFDMGLVRQLPRPQPEDVPPVEIQDRNILTVRVNLRDEVLVNSIHTPLVGIYEHTDELVGTAGRMSLSEKVKIFVRNEGNLPTLPILEEDDFGAPIGRRTFTGGVRVISLQSDATTSYRAFMAVQNELVKAFNELRDDAARRYFNMPFENLPQAQRDQISRLYPQNISEASIRIR
jgi:biopolymer transport protein ExbD